MRYVIFVFEGNDDPSLYTAPVPEEDADYLRRAAELLRPLSNEAYMNGPAVVLHTAARYSYVLDGAELFWCVEWEPGLLVLRFSPSGAMAWAALRSPVPNFGGREAFEADLDAYDEDADNPQYNLVFDPWDAQFDEVEREDQAFLPVEEEVHRRFAGALLPVNRLGQVMEARYAAERDAWRQRCLRNLEEWAGEGLRLP